MPMFPDGQDPLDAQQGAAQRAPLGAPAPDPFAAQPTATDAIGAAFRQNNPIVSVIEAIGAQSPNQRVDPSYNPMSVIKGTPFEQDAGRFVDDPNESVTQARLTQMQQEQNDRQTLAASGTTGTVAALGAGLLDPSFYLPLVGEAREASLLARAGRTAALGGLQSTVSSGALVASQQSRSWKEEIGGVATNTLLMGILGGALGRLAPEERVEATNALEAVRRDSTPVNPLDQSSMSLEQHITPGESGLSQGVEQRATELHAMGAAATPVEAAEAAHIEGLPPEIASEAYGPTAQDSIAAAAERGGQDPEYDPGGLIGEPGSGRGPAGGDGVEPVDGAPTAGVELGGQPGSAPLEEPQAPTAPTLPPPPAGAGFATAAAGADVSDVRDLNLKSFGLDKVPGVAAANAQLSPNLRVFSGISTQAKRAMAGLADTALRFTQHDRGIVTQEGGSLESRVRVQKARFQVAGHEALEHAYIEHRYGDAAPGVMQRGLDTVRDFRGQTPAGKLSYKDFKSAVYDAAYSGDSHPIPQVEQAARDLRAKVFDPVKKMAQETLGPDGRPMLSEELSPPKGDASFVPRAWNHEAVISKQYQLKQTIAGWLEREQATKVEAKDRLGDLQAQHAQLGGEVDKLEKRLSSLSDRQTDTASRIKERAGERDATINRTDTVEERQTKNREALDELREFVGAIREHASSDDDREQISDFERQIARLEQQGRDLDVRGREAQIPRTRSGRRLDDLQERADRQSLMRDLLDAARQNAVDRQAKVRGKIEKEIRDWKGNSTADAVAALKSRDEAERLRGLKQQAGIYEGAGDRLTSADGPVDRAVKRILASDQDLSRGELADRADEIIDRIIGSPDGRIPYDAASGGPKIGFTGGPAQELRGSLKSRDFAIPTALVKDFVHTDMEHVVSSFLRTMLPDIALTERFGDVDMTDTFRRIQEEYARKIGQDTTEAQSRKIAAQRDSDISDIAAVRDRLRGTYGWNPDPASRKIGAIVRDLHAATSLASLGTSVANRLNDIGAQAVMRYGLSNVFNDAWRPFFKSMVGMSPLAGVAKQQAKEMGVGIDGLLGHLRHNLSDINDNYLPGNKFSRGLAWANDRSMLVNQHGPWTDWMKAMAWVPAQAELGRLADRVVAGSASDKDLARLADANIDRAMAARISRQLEAHSDTVDGVRLASAGDWTDLGARDAFERAMSREANINVITAGIAQKPLFLSKPLGGLIGQFKSFVAGAHENILLSNLQQRDGRTMQGMLVAMTMGMLSYRLYTLLSGQDASPRPQDWIKEGLARSALTGWFNEANNTLAKFTAGKVDYNRLYGADRPLTRRTENSPMSELLGPSYSQLEGLTGIVTHTLSGHASAADVHAARHILPLQNLMGARIGFDSMEDGIDGAIGFKPRNHSPHEWAPGPTPYPQ